jgi:hypothetical protein
MMILRRRRVVVKKWAQAAHRQGKTHYRDMPGASPRVAI